VKNQGYEKTRDMKKPGDEKTRDMKKPGMPFSAP
jgi:hypothetical protein